MTVKALVKEGYSLAKSTVSRVWKSVGIEACKKSPAKIEKRKPRTPVIRTPTKIRKIADLCSSDDPIPQRSIAARVFVSLHTVTTIVHQDLGAKVRKKTKVHYLTEKAKKQRKDRARHFHELISNNLEYILTMDEAILPSDFKNGKTDFVYLSKKNVEDGRVVPPSVRSPGFPLQRMFAAGFSYRGQTRLYAIPRKAKVNADVFIQMVLRPMFDFDVPNLYGTDAHKVIFHMDCAPSHTAKKTVAWLRSRGIKFITKPEWLANSPNVSSMDFFTNGYLKKKLSHRTYSTEAGMNKAAKDEYKKIPLGMFRNSLDSWPARVLAIYKATGSQAPNY
ncbi:hypothetical protein RvY_15055 [Ramazzottius varieornatus]|uniref:Tc1-like transposase DDE domain-containing protein n=1 Tax=Ramazzottius varieornatus TaxID=947166 RepID=A0A1D1VTH6_RAMVA|nr:hypothetical protein RvY_15055 [Ramazzottius varieornatus]